VRARQLGFSVSEVPISFVDRVYGVAGWQRDCAVCQGPSLPVHHNVNGEPIKASFFSGVEIVIGRFYFYKNIDHVLLF
jgi:hypothetical protein